MSDLDSLGANARASIMVARKAVDDYRKVAEEKIIAQLEATSQYQNALAESSFADKNLQDARVVGDSAQTMRASAASARAKAKLKQLRESALANSDAVQEAKRLQASFTQQSSKVADKATASADDEMTKAIKERRLMEGMTVDQAARAARSRPELLRQQEGTAEYVWRIMGTVRYTNRITRDVLGHVHSSQVPVEGEVAEVQASFADGKLVSFQRVDKAGSRLAN